MVSIDQPAASPIRLPWRGGELPNVRDQRVVLVLDRNGEAAGCHEAPPALLLDPRRASEVALPLDPRRASEVALPRFPPSRKEHGAHSAAAEPRGSRT